MTTVKKPGDSFPDDHMVHTVSDPKSHDYGRTTAGGNQAPADYSPAPPGPKPQYVISMSGAPASTGGVQVGPNVGNGATIVVPDPLGTGTPVGPTGGTAGPRLNQGDAPRDDTGGQYVDI